MRTWGEEPCPKCGTPNMIDLGDMSDQTAADVETFRCFSCKTVCKLPEADGEDCEVAEDQTHADEDGKQVPI
jgi:hypothetical protein